VAVTQPEGGGDEFAAVAKLGGAEADLRHAAAVGKECGAVVRSHGCGRVCLPGKNVEYAF